MHFFHSFRNRYRAAFLSTELKGPQSRLSATWSKARLLRRLLSVLQRRRHAERGFTITELLTVVALIGILAAAAAPSMVTYLRDRRVQDAARNVADLYRTARSRAMGRGSAMMVRWNGTAGLPTATNPGHFGLYEGIVGPTSPMHQFMPATSCNSFNVANTQRFVKGFDERRARYEPATAQMYSVGATTQAYLEICFTPRGRTFFRLAAGGNWLPLTFVPRVEMENGFDSMSRFIVISPNGTTRVEERL